MNLSERSTIIFDYDGTIADTKAGIVATATTVLREWGIGPKELLRVGELIGPPFPQAFELVFGLPHEDAVEVTRRYRAIYTHLGVEAWPVFPGIRELLEELRAEGKRLAIASSKKASLIDRGLADNGLLGLFEFVGAQDGDKGEGKVAAIRAALGRTGAEPDGAVMVGDRYHDVEAASSCGIGCIGVRYGGTDQPGELEKAGAVAVAQTVEELRTLLVASQKVV